MDARAKHALVYPGAAVLLAAITWADYATGYELGLFILYFAPVAIVAWYGGRVAGVVSAVAGTACWFLSDWLSLHPYSGALLIYWETFTRLAALVVTALVLSMIRADLRRREELLDVISHDLRSPLGALAGQAKILGKRSGGDPFVAARVESILRCASRMEGMIEDLLDSARKESRQLHLRAEPLELGGWLAELVDRCSPVLEAGRVQLRVERPGLVVRADADRLERVVLNLLLNALKFSPPESPVELAASGAGGRVTLCVTDQGHGIPPDELSRVFERFYRGRRASGRAGLGLGLYSVRLLVEAHGGTVRAEGAPAGGTTFLVTLPAAPAAGADGRAASG